MVLPAAATTAPRQGVAGGAAVALVAEAIAVPAGLVTAMVMTRGLGPEIYGRFAVVATTVAISEWLLIALFAPAVVKFVAEADDWQPVAATAFRAYGLSGLAIAGLFLLLAGPIAAALGDPALAGDFRVFAVQVPIFAAGAVSRNILAGRGRYRQQAAASAVGWIGRAAFIVLFIELEFGLTGAILGSVCGTLAGAIVGLACVGPAVTGPGGLAGRRLMQLALPVFLGLIGARVIERMGLFVLQALGTADAEVGYYGAALTVMQVTGVVAAGVTPVLISTLTHASHRGDSAQVRRVSAGAMRLGVALLPLAAIVAGAARELTDLLFGPAFGPAAPALAALVVAAVALATSNLMGAVLIALNRAWVAALIVLVLLLAALGALLLFVPTYGAQGAALATMGAALVAGAVSILVVRTVLSVPLPKGTLARSGAITILACALSIGWATPGPLVIVKAVVLLVAVAAAFGATGELSRQEWTSLRQLVSQANRGPARPTD